MKVLNKILVLLSLFIGLGAVFGATMMIYDPSGTLLGMNQLLCFFQILPFANILFQNFIIIGIALLFFNGLTNAFNLILLFNNKIYGSLSSIICGIILILWTGLQFYIIPINHMSIIFFILGIIQIICGLIYYRKITKIKV